MDRSGKAKSFLDQDHSAGTRNKKAAIANYHRAKESKPRPPIMAPPKPASADAKAKLSAFAFGGPKDTDASKGTTAGNAIVLDSDDGIFSENGQEEEIDPIARLMGFPETPGNRGSSNKKHLNDDDDSPMHRDSEIPAEERITWQPSPRSTPFPPGTRSSARKGRRALSSSPVGSPRHSAETPVPTRQPLDLNTLARNLKTPNADPAMDLWARYSSAGPGMDTSPSMQRLFADKPSQRPSGGSPSGLRRSYTCGTEWPRSRLKRRKLEHVAENEDGTLPLEEEFPAVKGGKSKLTKVSRLVDQMHATLHRPVDDHHISSSSPLPCKSDRDFDPPSSPTPHLSNQRSPIRKPATRSPQRRAVGSPLRPIPQLRSEKSDISKLPSPLKDGNDSDYFDEDDDDLDMEMIDQVEQAAIQQSQMPALQIPSAMSSKVNSQLPSPAVAAPAEEDDYGADDDFGGDDFNELLSKYDSVPASAPVQSSVPAVAAKSNNNEVSVDGDDFGDDFDEDFDDLDEEELAMADKILVDKNPRFKDLLVFNKRTGAETHVYLQGTWAVTEVSAGDKISLIGRPSPSGAWFVNDKQNILILHPDTLISSTTVADSFHCIRKAVLADRVKSTNDKNEYMVYGSLLHETFQHALATNDFTTETFTAFIDTLVHRFMDDLYLIKTDIAQAKTYLESKIPLIQAFQKAFIGKWPRTAAEDIRGSDKPKIAVQKLLDIEEHVWAPTYGLKGNIDATLQVLVRDAGSSRTLTVPFELKTGRRSNGINHQTQTMLYTLLLSDRYGINIHEGLLHYLESGEVLRVKAVKDDLRAIIMRRNELAMYIKKKSGAPMLGQARGCKNCHAQTSCFIYHAAVEEGTPETSRVEAMFQEVTDHITPARKEFFKHWDSLLSKEERDTSRFQREIWLMTSAEREDKGRCLGQLQIVPSSVEETKGDKINRFKYTFRRGPAASGTHAFTDFHIIVGEPIMVSSEDGQLALAKGYALAITSDSITIGVDRRLHNTRTRQDGFDSVNNQVFAGTVDYVESNISASRFADTNVSYRIDKDEFANGFAQVRTNLVQLLIRDYDRLASMIIDLKAPSFKTTPTAYNVENAANLNEDQKNAIEKVMSAKDYALILGMPGTGKTTTIAEIIRALVAQGKSVLLTSYTHTAVDNILLKIRDLTKKTQILRLGNAMKIHPDVQNFALLQEHKPATMEELRKKYEEPLVVATTCLGINHPVFRVRKFDYCIVDEASQITLPVCLGPIRHAKTFVLVGDHYQLPPLVRDPEAKEGGLDISLFKRLSDAHPEAQVNLAHQYRMPEDIMLLSNTLIYNGMLKCGTEKVAAQTLKIPNMKGFYKFDRNTNCDGGSNCWLNDILDPSSRVCFLNTDSCPALEERSIGDIVQNPTEAVLVRQIVTSLIAASVPASSIGVISILRSQLKLITQEIQPHVSYTDFSALEMHTADKYQGRDKDVIVISLARSNETQSVGELLKDWRRINVAFTRAKKKLLIIGSKSTISGGYELLNDFVKLVESKNWALDLPPNAHLMHNQRPGASYASHSPSFAAPVSSLERKRSLEKENLTPSSSLQSENGKGTKRMKVPEKKGKTTAGGLLSGRPVLRNIANDLMG